MLNIFWLVVCLIFRFCIIRD